jgi:sugar phosphate isomerase/epimerase
VKFGICGEIFQDWDAIARTIELVKETGYDGLEIAPFTLAQTVTDIPAKKHPRARAQLFPWAANPGLLILRC